MVNPTGYTALDLVGYTDKGVYSSSANYVKNDLVHYNNKLWRCLIDDTSNVTPAEGVTWTIFVEEPGVMTGATSGAAGTGGTVPAPGAGDQTKFLKGDGTWDNPPLPPDMTGATSGGAGTHGLVPAPTSAEKDSFLKGDGSWDNPTAAPMTGATSQTDGTGGSVPAPLLGEQNKLLFGDGDWDDLDRLNRVLFFTSVACSATTGNFATINDAKITADHVVVNCVFANAAAITTEVTWTTADGSLTLNGTCTAATTADITLIKKDN